MKLAQTIYNRPDIAFQQEWDPRGFYVHDYPEAEILMADTLAPGAVHLGQVFKEKGEAQKVLLLMPRVRQVGTHLGEHLFSRVAPKFRKCAWVLPENLPLIVAKEVTRYLNEMFPFAVFRYRHEAEEWLLKD